MGQIVLIKEKEEGRVLEHALRPKSLEEFIGQSSIKENLGVFVRAALARGDPLEHVLFYGGPGLGKTTLAYILGNELKVGIHATTGPALERAGDLAAVLTGLQPRDILFIDEIHRLRRTTEEMLYKAMEDFSLSIILGKGPSAKILRLDLPPFTLIGATTRINMLSAPLRDRFGMTFHLDFYTTEDICRILKRSASILGISLGDDALEAIALRSRRTPRVANRLLKRIRDWVQVEEIQTITPKTVSAILSKLEIDNLGLDAIDRRILQIIVTKFRGGPVGLKTIAAATGEEIETIENIYEPYLLQLGFLDRTSRGRVATAAAYRHLNEKLVISN